MPISAVVDFSAIIGRNRHYQPARIACIRPRPAFTSNTKDKKSKEEEIANGETNNEHLTEETDESASQGDDEVYIVTNEEDDEEEEEPEEDTPDWKEYLKSDLEVAAQWDNAPLFRSKLWTDEETEQIKVDCEKQARKLIRHTNYIRSRNLEEEDDNSQEADDVPYSDTFYSWLVENSRNAETLLVCSTTDNNNSDWSLPPEFHEIEQSNWESKINWEGIPERNDQLKKKSTTTDANSFLNRLYNPVLADDTIDFSKCINWEGLDAPPEIHEALKNSVPLILEDSVAGSSVARLSIPPRRPTPLSRSEVYLRRCQAESPQQGNNQNSSMFFDYEKDETVIAQRQEKRAKMAIDKSKRVIEAMETLDLGGGKGRTITSSLMGPGGTERTGRPTKGITSSAYDAEHVDQLDLLLNHQLVKPDLKKTELRHFHRPRLPRNLVKKERLWQLKIRCMRESTGSHNKHDNHHHHSRGRSLLLGTHHPGAISQVKIKSESDLSAAEGHLIILEYCEERLPVQMAKGSACKIINYYRGDKSRCPISAGGGDRPPKLKRVSGDNAANSKTHKIEQKPRFEALDDTYDAAKAIEDLTCAFRKNSKQQEHKKQLDEQKKKDALEIIPEGITEMLLPKVHGPFIGEVEDGQVQSGLISNLFVAPIFRHNPEPSDFLLILGKKGGNKHHPQPMLSNNNLSVILRPFPSSVFCCGQTGKLYIHSS